MKKVKKVDVKAVAKVALSEVLMKAAAEAGYTVTSGEEYGLAKGAFVVADEATDVKVTLVTPKAGVTRYEVVSDADVAAAESQDTASA